jgi:hypothetical protein
MLIQASAGFGMLYRLDLAKAAMELLSVLIERQEPGGKVNASQAELGARVGLSRNSANTESRNLVLRPANCPRSPFRCTRLRHLGDSLRAVRAAG